MSSSVQGTSTHSLNFEALLSRDYTPAQVTQLIRNEQYKTDITHINKKKKKPLRNNNNNNEVELLRKSVEEAASKLVISLVSQTPAFAKHPISESERPEIVHTVLLPPVPVKRTYYTDIPPQFHQVELGDWESKIDWNGDLAKTAPPPEKDPMKLLEKPRNHHLDNLVFDDSIFNATKEELAEKARNVPLILELGVAGNSVAKHVYQNIVLSAQRPTPGHKSEAYQNRREREWSSKVTSTADVSKGSLHADKDEQAAIIAARQERRAKMAVDKTTRVAEAMGTMVIGGGRGRTVTSSLMGPGGTERTGRPSRTLTHGAMEIGYIEQLEMINTHALVRNDWSRVLLREYMRPKLPMSVCRPGLKWQFQVRSAPTGKKTDSVGQSSSYQAIMMGSTAGAISKELLRTEADLSPTEGKLVLLEYVEERPPIQLTKGMGSKIVNYYRGDKSRCPVSAGGGDRPARRKRGTDGSGVGQDGVQSNGKNDRPPRLEGPNRKTTVMDWVGKLPKKSQKDRSEQEAIDVMPEGVTEILHPRVHGPFMGNVEEGMTLTGFINNLFVAPMFRHEPETTDFLMILTPPGGASRPGERESMGVILREMPSSIFTVGQTEPRTNVHAPNSQAEKIFFNPFVSYQIARQITRSQARDGHGLRFDEVQDRVLPSLEIPTNTLRQRLKQVAVFDKTTQIWTTKAIGFEDYVGVDAIGRSIAPEGIAAFESAISARRRLSDIGIDQLIEKGAHAVVSVGVTMVYLAGQLNATRELHRKMKKLYEFNKSNKAISKVQLQYYEEASRELETVLKVTRQKYEVAQFIYEELQLAPWHLTREFIDVHKNGEGTGMMQLTGLGDPSGQGQGFSFLREVDTKPSKSVTNGALNAQIKKITGTADDLRKLTMTQMAALLRSYGMAQKQIDTLKRWDRVHIIRDLSTKAASDGIGDGLERFARGEKMKLSEQKRMYADRIKVIWKRQIAALSNQGDRDTAGNDGDGDDTDAPDGGEAKEKKALDSGKESDDSDDDDDFAAAIESDMVDRSEANQLVAAQAQAGEGAGALGQIRAATQDADLTRDARELAALKRQREEERVAKEGLSASRHGAPTPLPVQDRKVIRRRITKTHPDGRQTTTFKFIVKPNEVGPLLAKLQEDPDRQSRPARELNYEKDPEEKPPGHAMFEEEDAFEYSSKGRTHGRRRGGRRRGPSRGAGRSRHVQIGKLKSKTSTEERMRKRRKEEDEMEVYTSSAKRKGTSNRRERGSIRDRRPHIILAEKLEALRQEVESRPAAGPFLKAVNRKIIPRYYEVISHPIDLAAIRGKVSDFQYRTADAFVQDFELMKKNAIKFNGPSNPIALEATAIYDHVKSQVEAKRRELAPLEEAVSDMMSGNTKNTTKTKKKKVKSESTTNTAKVGGVSVNLGDISSSVHFGDGSDSDSDVSMGDLFDDL